MIIIIITVRRQDLLISSSTQSQINLLFTNKELPVNLPNSYKNKNYFIEQKTVNLCHETDQKYRGTFIIYHQLIWSWLIETKMSD